MTEQPWQAVETRVYTADGGFDIRNLPNATERAAFIVKAVNNHDALVDALRSVRSEIDLHKAPKLAAKIDAALAAVGSGDKQP